MSYRQDNAGCKIRKAVKNERKKNMISQSALLSVVPATGNVESSTYIIIIAVAGVLLIGAVAAGFITKKKK